MSADVNWLLSAMAQSGAALVAIVGGLLGSRYVALDAEQQAARRRAADVERRRDEAQAKLTDAQRELDDYVAEDLLGDSRVYAEIVRHTDEPPTLDQVLDLLGADKQQLPMEQLQKHLDFLVSEIRRAASELSELVPPAEEDHPDFDDFRVQHRLEPSHLDSWGWVYDELTETSREQARRNSRYRSWALAQLPISGSLQVSAIRGLASASERQGYESRLIGYRDTALREVELAEAELRLAQEHLSDSRQPEGFGLALKVLLILAVVAIGVPVTVMGFGPTSLPTWARVLVIVAFLSGIALLMRYLFVYASYLSEKSARTTLPTRLVGLLLPGRRRRGSG